MLSYRKATKNDALLYFNWVNDSNVRKLSFNSSEIDLDGHMKWFKTRIEDLNCTMLVFQNEEKLNIGQIRIQKETDSEALIGISIAKEHRGNGYSSEMLKMTSDSFFENNRDYRINAFINISNLNSKYAFEKAGFEFEKELMFKNNKSLLYIKKVK
jgi:RimJ/RimL family protein N-acetyltransferase